MFFKLGDFVSSDPTAMEFLVPSYGFPLKKMYTCISERDPSRDHHCHKIELRHKGDEEFNTFKEGALESLIEIKQ